MSTWTSCPYPSPAAPKWYRSQVHAIFLYWCKISNNCPSTSNPSAHIRCPFCRRLRVTTLWPSISPRLSTTRISSRDPTILGPLSRLDGYISNTKISLHDSRSMTNIARPAFLTIGPSPCQWTRVSDVTESAVSSNVVLTSKTRHWKILIPDSSDGPFVIPSVSAVYS